MSVLRQSTQVVIKLGPYLDKTDGVTAETGLGGAATEISKEPGAAFGTGPTLGTHDAEGWYPVTLTTTHTNTVGRFIIKGQDAATHLPVWHEFTVVEEAVYDRDYAASATGVDADWTDGGRLDLLLDDVPTTAEFEARTLVSASYFDPAADTVGTVTTVTSAGLSAAAVDLIWDELLTGATHNVATSSGRRLRQIEAGFVVDNGTAQAGAAGTITLASTADGTNDDIYRGDRIIITEGTGAGEHDIVVSYDASTRIATMAENWVVIPDATSIYEVQPASVDVETWQHVVVSASSTSALPEVDAKSISDNATTANTLELSMAGTITGAAATGTLSTTQATTDLSGFTDDQLIGRVIVFTSGPADGEATDITDYANTNGLLTFTALTLAPENGNTFIII